MVTGDVLLSGGRGGAAMAVSIFEDLVLRERGDPLLEVAVPQRQQRALVVEEGNARG